MLIKRYQSSFINQTGHPHRKMTHVARWHIVSDSNQREFSFRLIIMSWMRWGTQITCNMPQSAPTAHTSSLKIMTIAHCQVQGTVAWICLHKIFALRSMIHTLWPSCWVGGADWTIVLIFFCQKSLTVFFFLQFQAQVILTLPSCPLDNTSCIGLKY